ncbi:zinc finger domain-containing protein, partial [Escherichia coli]
MAILVNCPSCRRKLRVPDALLGKKVKCPTCQTLFEGVPEPSA